MSDQIKCKWSGCDNTFDQNYPGKFCPEHTCNVVGCWKARDPLRTTRACGMHSDDVDDATIIGARMAASTLRHDPNDAPEVRARAIMRRSVIRTMAAEDAGECFEQIERLGLAPLGTTRGEAESTDVADFCKRAIESLDIVEDSADEKEARRLYDRTFREEWKRLAAGKPERTRTPHDVMKARLREHLVELIARAFIAGAMAEASDKIPSVDTAAHLRAARELGIESAPTMVEGALDAILQVIA